MSKKMKLKEWFENELEYAKQVKQNYMRLEAEEKMKQYWKGYVAAMEWILKNFETFRELADLERREGDAK